MAVKAITDAEFDSLVLGADKATLVDFWADWCGPCKQLAPIIEELSEQYGDKMNFFKMDTNTNTATPAKLGVMALPTVQIYVRGELVKQLQGSRPKGALVKVIEEFI